MSELKSPLFWLGTNIFGYTVDRGQSFRLMEAYMKEFSFLAIDTAAAYSKGESELIIGEFIHAHGLQRASLKISTKVEAESGNGDLKSSNWIVEKAFASMERLAVDWLDVFFLHNPSHFAQPDVLGKLFQDLPKESIGQIGLSNPDSSVWSRSFWESSGATALQEFRNLFCDKKPIHGFSNDLTLNMAYGLMGRGVLFQSKRDDHMSRVHANSRLSNIYDSKEVRLARNWLSSYSASVGFKEGQILLGFAHACGISPIVAIRNLNQFKELRVEMDPESLSRLKTKLQERQIPKVPREYLGGPRDSSI